MRTIWIAVAAYALLYGLTVLLTKDEAVLVAGLLIGLVLLVPASFATLRGQRTRAGRKPVGSRH